MTLNSRGFDRRGVADPIEPALGPRLIATAAQLGEPAGLYRVIDAGLIISGIERTVGIVSPRRISRAGGAIAWASGADRRPEHAWFEDRGPPRTLLAFITVADHMVLFGSAVAAMHVAEGAGAPLIEKVRFAADLYGAFPVKGLFPRWLGSRSADCSLGFAHSSLFGAGKAVLRPVACDQVPGARGRGQGTETLAQLGGLPP